MNHNIQRIQSYCATDLSEQTQLLRFIIGNMRLRAVVLSTLIFGSFFGSQRVEASPPTQQEILGAESRRNFDAILKYLWPALKSAGKAGRIYYYAACQSDDDYQIYFPRVSVQPPSKSNTGLAAVQEMFEKDKDVRVTERQPGIINIRIGIIPDAILDTKISLLMLQPDNQYNFTLAYAAIANTKEVQAAMRKLGVSMPPVLLNGLVVQPDEQLPHPPLFDDERYHGPSARLRCEDIQGYCSIRSLYATTRI